MHRINAALLSVLLLTACAPGSQEPETISASEAAAAQDDALASLVEAERAFARNSREEGMRTAFLNYMGPGSVVFRPGPVDAVEATQQQPESEDTLDWDPQVAEVSASGDFGYTSGPWVYTEAGKDPGGYGHYFSVWKRQDDGDWKVALDIGTFNPAPEAPIAGWDGGSNPDRWMPADGEVVSPDAALQRVHEREEELAAALGNMGLEDGYRKFLTDDARLMRNGRQPMMDAAGRDGLLADESGAYEWERQRSGIADSGDLAYVSGAYTRTGEMGDLTKGHYVRIWRRVPGGDWKVAVDLILPLPPRLQPGAEGASES